MQKMQNNKSRGRAWQEKACQGFQADLCAVGSKAPPGHRVVGRSRTVIPVSVKIWVETFDLDHPATAWITWAGCNLNANKLSSTYRFRHPGTHPPIFRSFVGQRPPCLKPSSDIAVEGCLYCFFFVPGDYTHQHKWTTFHLDRDAQATKTSHSYSASLRAFLVPARWNWSATWTSFCNFLWLITLPEGNGLNLTAPSALTWQFNEGCKHKARQRSETPRMVLKWSESDHTESIESFVENQLA